MKRVAYLLDSFPRLSHTFVFNEILEVKRGGVDVKIFSLKAMGDGMIHFDGKRLSRETYYFSPCHNVCRIQLYLYHLYFLLSSPLRYIHTFLFALKRRHKGMLWRLKKSVIYAFPIHRQEIHHIHSHFLGGASGYAMLISMLLNIPFTFTAHGYYHMYKAPPNDFDDRWRKAKMVITISDYNRVYLHETFGIPLEKIEMIHCGVKSDFFLHHVEYTKKENIILAVGRLVLNKGHIYLIQACSILKDRGHSFQCLIIGDGEERSNLEKLIKELEMIHCISLEGAKSLEELKDYYNRAKVFVQPSLHETMGVAAMEALAHGIPVIATNVYGVSELVIHGQNGLLVNPYDPETLADYIATLLTDTARCQQLGESGLQKVQEDFNLQQEVQKLRNAWFV